MISYFILIKLSSFQFRLAITSLKKFLRVLTQFDDQPIPINPCLIYENTKNEKKISCTLNTFPTILSKRASIKDSFLCPSLFSSFLWIILGDWVERPVWSRWKSKKSRWILSFIETDDFLDHSKELNHALNLLIKFRSISILVREHIPLGACRLT